MTKLFEQKLFNLIERILRQILEGNNEVWLDSKGLTEQFACFTKDWQKNYGETLPRTQAIVDGEHKTHWMYPRNKIQRMMINGEIKNLSTINNKERKRVMKNLNAKDIIGMTLSSIVLFVILFMSAIIQG